MPPLINRQDSFLVDTVIKDVKRILDDFLNNDWNGAISQLEAKSSYHPYYSTFLSYLLSLKAGVTFDQVCILRSHSHYQQVAKYGLTMS